jgi:hypothetical protein
MIEVEGMIKNHAFTILIDLGDSHSYIDPRVVLNLQLLRNKHGKSCLVQIATGTKRKVMELVKSCPVDMNGLSTRDELNVLPLGSYDCLISVKCMCKEKSPLFGSLGMTKRSSRKSRGRRETNLPFSETFLKGNHLLESREWLR